MAVKGFRDGSSKNNGGSGCGIVIKGCRQGQMGDDQPHCGTIESWYGHGEVKGVFPTNACVFTISIGALTKLLTNNDVAMLEFGKFEFENEM